MLLLPLHGNMDYLPQDLLVKLEYDKILEIIKQSAHGEEGYDRIERLKPLHDFKEICKLLDEVDESHRAIQRSEPIPIVEYEQIGQDVEWLKTNGYVLEIDSILRIYRSINASNELRLYLVKQSVKMLPLLKKKGAEIENLTPILKSINKIFDLDGSVKQNASPALSKIFKSIISKSRQLDSVFRDLATKFKQQGWLADNVETLRNGRRVLSVNAENKRKIKGIIHDESATGKTAYVEPDRVIEINNDLFDLENEKLKEVHKLIKTLCDELRPYRQAILNNHEILIDFDIINAKAIFAQAINASRPKVKDQPSLGFKNAFHPLLLWMNEKVKKKTIPFDLSLHNKNRILVISGPNAGGKSVTMKAVGLIQLMLQTGMLVPVDANSEMGIYKDIFCDIGDQQSLEDDLSTYSSRLLNMKNFVAKANDHSLILIDEFGSGTDPKIGGALAESLLRLFNFKKVYGVITTHYSNIKYFAFKTKGIINGSMVFDKELLKPTYQLKVGKPGSSFAFEIAKKIGLDKKVMDYAKHKTGKNERAIDELLVKLQSEKKSLEKRIGHLEDREKHLEKLIRNYEQMYGELEINRKKLKLERKAKKFQKEDEENQELQKLLKELRKKESAEAVEKVIKAKKQTKKVLKNEIVDLKEDVFYKDKYEVSEFTVGGFARLRDGGSIGKIINIKKDVIEIALGVMQMKLNVKELIPAGEPIEINSKKHVTTDINFVHNFESKLDIRGYTVVDALAFVQEFIDTALVQNVTQLTILHGIGTGKLKQAVHKKLKEYKGIRKIWHPEENFGGEAITYISL